MPLESLHKCRDGKGIWKDVAPLLLLWLHKTLLRDSKTSLDKVVQANQCFEVQRHHIKKLTKRHTYLLQKMHQA